MNARHLLALIASQCTNLAATTSNRTFLMPRAPLQNMALEQATWHRQVGSTVQTYHGGTLQITGMYQHSANKGDLGKYFGYYAPKAQEFRDYINVVNSSGHDTNGGMKDQPDFDTTIGDNTWAEYIVHNTGSTINNLADKLQFRPTQEISSVRLDAYKNFDEVARGLFFSASLPLSHVKNSMGLTRIGTFSPINIAPTHPAYGKTLFDFFAGDVYNFDTTNNKEMLQYPLNYAKIDGSRHRTGFSDLATTLGYKIINKKDHWVGLGLNMVVPTGNRPTGEYVFEPLLGNAGHWAFGGSLDATFKLWHKHDGNSVSCSTVVRALYLLPATEKRTLGMRKDDGTSIPFGVYYAVGRLFAHPVTPFANVSTQDLKVEPKLQVEGLCNLNFNFKTIDLNVGYNIFAKQRETIALKHAWNNDTYAIAFEDYTTFSSPLFGQTNFGDKTQVDSNIMGKKQPINEQNLDFRAATAPSLVSHKFYGTLSYTSKDKTPLLFGIGGSYEFGSANTGIDNYALWLQSSLAF